MHRLSKKINASVATELSRSQREMWLRKQLKAIQAELAENGSEIGGDQKADGRDEVDEIARRLDEAQLSKPARAVAERELRRLRGMQPMQAEHAVLLGYLDWLASMPWSKASADSLDLDRAKRILDEQHYGLAKVGAGEALALALALKLALALARTLKPILPLTPHPRPSPLTLAPHPTPR